MLRWKDVLTYARYGNPEPPYRNAYCRSYGPERYACAGCGSRLFAAEAKYHAISGWPSFRQPASRAAIRYAFDESFGMQRIEARCNVCEGHLGHVFADGPVPAGLRYCINSASLVLEEYAGQRA